MKISKHTFYIYLIIFIGLVSLLPISNVYADDTNTASDTPNTDTTTTSNESTSTVDSLQTPVALSDDNASAAFASSNLMQTSMAAYSALGTPYSAFGSSTLPFSDPDFEGFKNDNPPALKSSTYVEKQMGSNSLTTYTTGDVMLYSGSSVSDNDIYISNMTDSELKALTVSDFTFAANSPVKSSDVTMTYNQSQKKINLTFNKTSIMKTNGAGTQAILNIRSGTKTAQITIGAYRNYVSYPADKIQQSDQFDLYYMINNAKKDVDSTDATGTAPVVATPNFYLYDKTTKKKVYALYEGDMIDRPKDKTNLFAGINNQVNASTDYYAAPIDHTLIQKDPNNSKRILVQYDFYPTYGNVKARYRMFMVMEPNESGDAINVRQRVINYSSTGATYNIWMLRKYFTSLDGKNNVPILFTDLISSGINAGKPRGLYISNYPNDHTSPYRLTFDFSGDNGPSGFGGSIYRDIPFSSPTDVGVNEVGHKPDTEVLDAGTNSTAISMLWSPAKVGRPGYGKSSNEMGFTVNYDYSLAPNLRMSQDTVNYNPGDATTLPALNLSGQVQDYDSSQVKVFYTIDTPVTSSSATQNNARKLSTVSVSASDNDNSTWVNFPGNQATPTTSAAITNQTDLQKLADGGAHTIYVYAFDNGSRDGSKPKNLMSNIEAVKVPALSTVTIQYLDQDWTMLQPNKTIRGAIGDRYDTSDENYFPRRLLKDGVQYTLNSIPGGANGVISGNQIIQLMYTKLPGTLSITAPSTLDFGKHQLMAGTNTATIQTQDKPVVVTDTTGNPIWSLFMQATPFTQVGGSQTMPNVLKYRQSDASLLNITTDPQKILSYSDVNSPITNSTSTTDLDDYWWQTVDGNKQQISGPIIQGDRDQMKSGKFQSTITWTLQNSLN